MTDKLTDATIKRLPAPATGNKVYFDSEVRGFGVRVTKAGARAFVLQYRNRQGRERRYTIGAFPDWSATGARAEAKRLKAEVRVNGADPMGSLEAARGEPTMTDLATRYLEEHAIKKRSREDDERMFRLFLLPAFGHHKVAEISFANCDGLHRKITRRGTATRANRVISLMSKAFNLAIRWGWRSDNPAKGIERNQETQRHRYLSPEELTRLTTALAAYGDQTAANIIRMLLLTGARRGEVLTAKWQDFNLTEGTWTKPAGATKQKTMHRVPLSAPVRTLLAGLDQSGEYLFPGRHGGPRSDIKKPWLAIIAAANLNDFKIHDLRHSFASILAGSGLSLPIVGALLGHSNPSTTQRYAHLMDSPLRSAVERAGAVITGRPAATVTELRSKKRR